MSGAELGSAGRFRIGGTNRYDIDCNLPLGGMPMSRPTAYARGAKNGAKIGNGDSFFCRGRANTPPHHHHPPAAEGVQGTEAGYHAEYRADATLKPIGPTNNVVVAGNPNADPTFLEDTSTIEPDGADQEYLARCWRGDAIFPASYNTDTQAGDRNCSNGIHGAIAQCR